MAWKKGVPRQKLEDVQKLDVELPQEEQGGVDEEIDKSTQSKPDTIFPPTLPRTKEGVEDTDLINMIFRCTNEKPHHSKGLEGPTVVSCRWCGKKAYPHKRKVGDNFVLVK